MHTTVYASDYATLDSDVIHGGGTDQTEVLQGLLDKALEWGHLHLIMDGAALIRGLKVHSNTTIQCMDKSCGFYLADDSDCAVLCNSNPGYEEVRTRNVTLVGGTYNHNCLHQAHDVPCNDPALTSDAPDGQGVHWTVSLEFIGIEDLTVRDVTVRDQRTFAFTVGNFRRVYIENTFFELENEILFGNQDGFHFWGPGQFLTVKNVGGRTQDDFMNIGPDERDGVSSITDVLVDGVMLDNAYQAIRLLSRDKGRLDRVTVRNVTGEYRCFGFYVNPWFPEEMGNFGNIVFENIDLRPGENPYANTLYNVRPVLFSIGGDFEALTLRNIQWHHPNDDREVFRIGCPFHDADRPFTRKPRIRSLLIDGLQLCDEEGGSREAAYITVRGIVDRLTIRDADVLRRGEDKDAGCFLKTRPDAEIRRLTLDRVSADNVSTLLELNEGRVERLLLNGVVTEGVADPIKGTPRAVCGEITELK
ncbi:MAG: hypothetical protein IJZ13_03410 [Clostridia bacterium]|nr:hypothetical protein [Clostridia bacterium]